MKVWNLLYKDWGGVLSGQHRQHRPHITLTTWQLYYFVFFGHTFLLDPWYGLIKVWKIVLIRLGRSFIRSTQAAQAAHYTDYLTIILVGFPLPYLLVGQNVLVLISNIIFGMHLVRGAQGAHLTCNMPSVGSTLFLGRTRRTPENPFLQHLFILLFFLRRTRRTPKDPISQNLFVLLFSEAHKTHTNNPCLFKYCSLIHETSFLPSLLSHLVSEVHKAHT